MKNKKDSKLEKIRTEIIKNKIESEIQYINRIINRMERRLKNMFTGGLLISLGLGLLFIYYGYSYGSFCMGLIFGLSLEGLINLKTNSRIRKGLLKTI